MTRLGTKDPMRPSSRYLYPAWLRPATIRDTAHAGIGPAGTGPDEQTDRAWRVWERLRDFDRRKATYVDVVLAVVLFVLCTGWLFDSHAEHPNLGVVAALIFPLIFRRRAPMVVFFAIAAVAFIQWLVTGPALADASLLVAMYTVAVESAWIAVAIAMATLETGVVMATIHWTPTGNDVKSLVFLTGLAIAALLAGVVVRALRSQLDWLAERAARLEIERDQQASLSAAAERARIAREMHDVVSHNIQVMVTLADAAAAAQRADPARAADTMREVSSTGRQALTDMRRMLGVLREEPGAVGPGPGPGPRPGSDSTGAGAGGRAALAPQPGLADLDALVERVRGTGLTVSVEQAGRPFEVSGAAGLTVYRIVQEALTNALKHADDPATVEVHLDFEDPDISVRVRDDGRTRVAAPVPVSHAANGANGANGNGAAHGNGSGGHGGHGGHGVAGMTERAAAFGGVLRAGPSATGGWEVRATLRDCKAPVAP
jgi:signal transduction histidine kinase